MRKKILVIRNDKIGDLVLTTPVFREIKKHFPESEITAVVSKVNKPIIEKNKNIDKILVIDFPKKDFKSFFRFFKGYLKIKKEKFDVGFDLRGSRINSAFLLFLPRIKKRISFSKFHNISPFLTKNILFKDFYNIHLTNQNLQIINQGLGINAADNFPEIVVDEEDKKALMNFLEKNKLKNKKYVCICPGGHYQRWPHVEKLIEFFKREYAKYKILIAGGEEERKMIQWLAKKYNCLEIINLNLRLTYLLFEKSSLIITNDGGSMHLAGTAKANVISFFGPSYPEHQKPLNKNSVVFQKKDSSGKGDISLITFEEVVKEVNKFLKKKNEK